MKPLRVLVSGYIGFNNFGDEAIFYALSSHLKKSGYKISTLCTNCNEVSEKYGVTTYKFKSSFDIIKAITGCDVLISGGGSLLQNKTSNFSLYYYLFIIFLAKLFFKKVIIFAQGIEPIRGKFNKFFTKIILKTVDYITVRDEKSLKLLEKNNIKANLLSDPVYSLLQDTDISKNKSGLIIQLRNFECIDDKFISNLAESVSKNYKEDDISVFSFQDEYDKDICLKFIEKLKTWGKSAKFISNKNIDETIKTINNSKYMISTRLHGIIVSQGLKTKTFALIYDDKIKTIADELNIPNIDINNYSTDELTQKFALFFNSPDNTKEYRRFNWEYLDNKIKSFKG